jgi:hypothetical protein
MAKNQAHARSGLRAEKSSASRIGRAAPRSKQQTAKGPVRSRQKARQVVVAIGGADCRRVAGHRVGAIVGTCERGPLVDYPGNPHGPLVARTIVPLPSGVAAEAPGEALLVFEHERSDQPIVVGLLVSAADAGGGALHAIGALAAAGAARAITARVDGKQVVIDAQDEIVLRCGDASITLRRNGRVVIRGAYVETRSRGVNRIKGGSVQIN